VYLHYVFDLWVQWWRNRFAGGDVIAVRFADLCRTRHKSAYAACRVMPRRLDRCRSVMVVGLLDAA
jgi:hypothetical protein